MFLETSVQMIIKILTADMLCYLRTKGSQVFQRSVRWTDMTEISMKGPLTRFHKSKREETSPRFHSAAIEVKTLLLAMFTSA